MIGTKLATIIVMTKKLLTMPSLQRENGKLVLMSECFPLAITVAVTV